MGEVEEVHEEIPLVEEEEALEGHEALLELEGAHEVLEQHARGAAVGGLDRGGVLARLRGVGERRRRVALCQHDVCERSLEQQSCS